jgi:hypothetical protein
MLSDEFDTEGGRDRLPPEPTPRRVGPLDAEQRRVLVRTVVDLKTKGKSDDVIVAVLARQFGMDRKTARRYIRLAVRSMVREIDRDARELKAISYATYMSLVADKDVMSRDRVRARENADKLLGIVAPAKHAETDAAGNDAESVEAIIRKRISELTDEELDTFRAGGPGASDIRRRLLDRASGSN